MARAEKGPQHVVFLERCSWEWASQCTLDNLHSRLQFRPQLATLFFATGTYLKRGTARVGMVSWKVGAQLELETCPGAGLLGL